MNMTREDAKCCVGAGWSSLVDAIFDQLPPDAYISCVKEKFGGLRFYVDGVGPRVLDFIDEMEDRSREICEICGAPGKPRDDGWIKTLCDRHSRKQAQKTPDI